MGYQQRKWYKNMVYLNPQRPQMLTLFHTPQWNVPPSHKQMKQSWTKCVHILVYMYIINKSTNVICYIYIYTYYILYIMYIILPHAKPRNHNTSVRSVGSLQRSQVTRQMPIGCPKSVLPSGYPTDPWCPVCWWQENLSSSSVNTW